MPLEAHVVDPGEERELAPVRLLGENGDGAGLGQRLDHQDARHDRAAGKVPGQVPLVLADALAGDDARPGSSSVTSSSRRNGSRWGRIASISAPGRADGRSRGCARSSSRAPKPGAAAMDVALRRADRHARDPRDLLVGRPSASRRTTTARCVGGEPGEPVDELAPQVAEHASARRVRSSPAARPRSTAAARSGGRAGAACRSRQVLTTSRWSHVANCASPRNWRSRVQSLTSDSWAASRASSRSPRSWAASRLTRGRVALDERVERRRSPARAFATSARSLSFR